MATTQKIKMKTFKLFISEKGKNPLLLLSVVLGYFIFCCGTCSKEDTNPVQPANSPPYESSNKYNFDGAAHHLQDFNVTNNAPLYDVFGTPLGCTASSTRRFQGMETILLSNGTFLFYSWGENGERSGHISQDNIINGSPTINSSWRGGDGTLWNGRPAPDVGTTLIVDSKPIPDWRPDGHPVYPYGRQVCSNGEPYTYLVWSWINKVGGGINRAIMKDGTAFYPAKVDAIITELPEGRIKVIYGSIQTNEGIRIYGWTVYSHTEFTDNVEQIHLRQ